MDEDERGEDTDLCKYEAQKREREGDRDLEGAILNHLRDEPPLDGNLAFGLCGNLGERTDRQVDRVAVRAGRAIIGNGHGDALSIVGVDDFNLLSAERRLVARVAIAVLVHGSDERAVRVHSATSAGNAVLVEERRHTAGDE